MASDTNKNIESAELVLPCADFEAEFTFFTEQLNFKIHSIFPADNPNVAVIFGYGLRIRLEQNDANTDGNNQIQIGLNCKSKITGKSEITSPNGVKIKFTETNKSIELPKYKPEIVVNKFCETADWVKGRANMLYRDLVPMREGGRIIASHIHIPKGGEVPDYVHYHDIDFQMIYCYKGWAKLIYEDQGEPFIFKAGDCVLQPPKIRHRVLESSDNLEVIEVSSPAEHETFAEHRITLPTEKIDIKRDFSGQKFVRHIAEEAVWTDYRIKGFKCRDTGISEATKHFSSVKIIRLNSILDKGFVSHDTDFCFLFILEGDTELNFVDVSESLKSGDSLVIPSRAEYYFAKCSEDLEILEVMLQQKN